MKNNRSRKRKRSSAVALRRSAATIQRATGLRSAINHLYDKLRFPGSEKDERRVHGTGSHHDTPADRMRFATALVMAAESIHAMIVWLTYIAEADSDTLIRVSVAVTVTMIAQVMVLLDRRNIR